MTINLTPEQERWIQAVIRRGGYGSVEEVVEAALTAVEQLALPEFAGTQQELDTLLPEGLASKQLAEGEFWSSVGKQTDAMLAEHKTSPRSCMFCIGKLPPMMSCGSFGIIRYDKSSGGRRSLARLPSGAPFTRYAWVLL